MSPTFERGERAGVGDWLKLSAIFTVLMGVIWLRAKLGWMVYGDAVADLIAKVLP